MIKTKRQLNSHTSCNVWLEGGIPGINRSFYCTVVGAGRAAGSYAFDVIILLLKARSLPDTP